MKGMTNMVSLAKLARIAPLTTGEIMTLNTDATCGHNNAIQV